MNPSIYNKAKSFCKRYRVWRTTLIVIACSIIIALAVNIFRFLSVYMESKPAGPVLSAQNVPHKNNLEYPYVDRESIDYSAFEAIRQYSHSSDISFMRKATSKFNYSDEKVPLINVFNRAGTDFLERFVRSIDFPTDTLMIVQDSLEDTRLLSLVRSLRADLSIKKYIRNIRHVVNINNTGCAQAWNTVIRLYPGEPFYLYAANDVLLPPGGLRTFYRAVKKAQKEEPRLGLISTEAYYGVRTRGWKRQVIYKNEFNAMFWAYTRQGVLRSGLYDENFFPGYYEDDEIVYRNFVSGMESRYVPEVIVTHGYPSGYYRTGTMIEDLQNIFIAEVKRSTNKPYMQTKWGPAVENGVRLRVKQMISAGLDVFQRYCGRDDNDVPVQYKGFFCRPFNQSIYTIMDWPFHPKLRSCIKNGNEGDTCNKYLQDFAKAPFSV